MDTYSQFENLYKQHYQALVNFAMNMVNDNNAAKDIVQEVFIRLWNRREEIEFGPYIKSYLFKAVTNTSLNHLQSNKKRLQIFQTLINKNPIIRDVPTEMEKKEFQNKVREAKQGVETPPHPTIAPTMATYKRLLPLRHRQAAGRTNQGVIMA